MKCARHVYARVYYINSFQNKLKLKLSALIFQPPLIMTTFVEKFSYRFEVWKVNKQTLRWNQILNFFELGYTVKIKRYCYLRQGIHINVIQKTTIVREGKI